MKYTVDQPAAAAANKRRSMQRAKGRQRASSFNSPNYNLGYFAYAARRANNRADFRAQHGPVRVLMKDGKPVTPDAA